MIGALKFLELSRRFWFSSMRACEDRGRINMSDLEYQLFQLAQRIMAGKGTSDEWAETVRILSTVSHDYMPPQSEAALRQHTELFRLIRQE